MAAGFNDVFEVVRLDCRAGDNSRFFGGMAGQKVWNRAVAVFGKRGSGFRDINGRISGRSGERVQEDREGY